GKADVEFAGLRARATLDRDSDSPLAGELDGIADEVDQDLFKPRHIAVDGRRQLRVEMQLQLQSFLCRAGSEEFHRLLDTSEEVERTAFDLKFSCLDLR